jgi:hypothetical protein
MKLTITATTCGLLMILTLTGVRPAVEPGTTVKSANLTPQPSKAVSQDTQEWDPERDGIGDLQGAVQLSPEEAAKKNKTTIPIVGQRFTPDEFLKYVKDNVVPALKNSVGWKPTFIVIHNTAKPSIAQRPNGFSRDHMLSLSYYYGVKQGWWSGPHLFVDQNGIWVFSRLDKAGTHSPCYNAKSWGIEQLGDFDTESYDTGAGAKIRDNAMAAVAILSIAGNITAGPKNKNNPLRLHKEDTCTTHVCPGSHCDKNEIVSRVEDAKQTWRTKWDAP